MIPMRQCFGRTKDLNRCSRKGRWRWFCQEHKRQPLAWLFGLVFTVIAGSASIYSVVVIWLEDSASSSSGKEPGSAGGLVPPLSLSSVVHKEHLIAFEVATDVGLISVFDPKALEHRFRDEETWWIDDGALLTEMNRGNGIFLSTGYDGYFEVLVHGKNPRLMTEKELSLTLVCDGGLIYVGGYPLDGLKQQDEPFGGDYFSCEKGAYNVRVRVKKNVVDLSFSPVETFTRNSVHSISHFDEL